MTRPLPFLATRSRSSRVVAISPIGSTTMSQLRLAISAARAMDDTFVCRDDVKAAMHRGGAGRARRASGPIPKPPARNSTRSRKHRTNQGANMPLRDSLSNTWRHSRFPFPMSRASEFLATFWWQRAALAFLISLRKRAGSRFVIQHGSHAAFMGCWARVLLAYFKIAVALDGYPPRVAGVQHFLPFGRCCRPLRRQT
jgi:hypothetical protein